MRFVRSFMTLLPAGAVALKAMPLWAEEAEKAKASLPQLDMGFFPGQIFWLVISFASLYVMLSRFVLPGVEVTQKKRQAVIAAELKAAAAANNAAKKIIAEYEKTLADARAKASMNNVTAKTARESMERQAEQQKTLAAQVHQAEIRIGAARDAALSGVQAAALEIAGAAIEKITGQKLRANP